MKLNILSLFTAGLLALALNVSADQVLSGVYRKGSNITEPKPAKSKHLRTEAGGFGVTDAKEVKYVLYVDIIKPFKRPMYVKAEFQNPLGEPFIEEGEIPAGHRSLQLIHGHVKGLKIHRSYWVKIGIYEQDDRTAPVDTLTQNIKSYVDTTSDSIIIKNDLQQGLE